MHATLINPLHLRLPLIPSSLLASIISFWTNPRLSFAHPPTNLFHNSLFSYLPSFYPSFLYLHHNFIAALYLSVSGPLVSSFVQSILIPENFCSALDNSLWYLTHFSNGYSSYRSPEITAKCHFPNWILWHSKQRTFRLSLASLAVITSSKQKDRGKINE